MANLHLKFKSTRLLLLLTVDEIIREQKSQKCVKISTTDFST